VSLPFPPPALHWEMQQKQVIHLQKACQHWLSLFLFLHLLLCSKNKQLVTLKLTVAFAACLLECNNKNQVGTAHNHCHCQPLIFFLQSIRAHHHFPFLFFSSTAFSTRRTNNMLVYSLPFSPLPASLLPPPFHWKWKRKKLLVQLILTCLFFPLLHFMECNNKNNKQVGVQLAVRIAACFFLFLYCTEKCNKTNNSLQKAWHHCLPFLFSSTQFCKQKQTTSWL